MQRSAARCNTRVAYLPLRPLSTYLSLHVQGTALRSRYLHSKVIAPLRSRFLSSIPLAVLDYKVLTNGRLSFLTNGTSCKVGRYIRYVDTQQVEEGLLEESNSRLTSDSYVQH